MTRHYRVAVSALQLYNTKDDVHLFQAAFEKLEKALGGAMTDIRIYNDPMSHSYIIEAKEVPQPPPSRGYSWQGKLSYATTTTNPQWYPQQYPSARVYLSSEDYVDYVHPDPPEPMWSTHPVTGWRYFVWDDFECGLFGNRREWTQSTLEAVCGKGYAHRSPDWDCECGIYLSTGPPDFSDSPHMVMAQVEATGLVIEHEYGWRAERAKMLTLWVPPKYVYEVRKAYPDVTVIPWRRRS